MRCEKLSKAFMEHRVSTMRIRVDSESVVTFQYPKPSNLPELRTLLGLVGYRKFIWNFAKIAHSLFGLRCQNTT